MVSKQEIPVAGLKLTVHGLEEYKAKGSQGPVAIMFALHGRLQQSSSMDPIAQALCGLNERAGTRRHMIVVAFDQPNHGTRLVHPLANYGWKERSNQNPTHAQDMWSFFYSTSRTVSELIDVIEDYLFGPQERSRVQVWGVVGFSMGGHGAFMASANGTYARGVHVLVMSMIK
ncbi:hypothetical protein BX666DRAFT_1853037 [Dichotomocladium elegans]|nr:hypothetical protein BX666DRAFT_1853037 [Dichotomocladium elegans]